MDVNWPEAAGAVIAVLAWIEAHRSRSRTDVIRDAVDEAIKAARDHVDERVNNLGKNLGGRLERLEGGEDGRRRRR